MAGRDTAKRTKLNKLGGGTDWSKTKPCAKAAAKDLAEGLIKLYAERQRRPGFAFSPDSPWQKEFEDAFDYEETDDQLRAIAEIKADMERSAPMDRLLCGDVGYGKTEVALRAVMKCILDGKQAAILVPTTVLAQQHYATAMHRFRAFPVTVEVLSQNPDPKQVHILEDPPAGKVDLLIGTHSLLQKGVHFKDLGLLVIDEEQRFGVTHKEKLKGGPGQVDTLTLSATPIPRTLNMALSGIRDMSTIEVPPVDRQPVQTYVLEHNWSVIADAIRRELARGGQVYYMHNRVETIDRHRRPAPADAGRRRRYRRRARQDGRGAQLSSVMQQMVRRRGGHPGLHDDHRDGHRHSECQHPHHRGRRPPRPRPAAPDPRRAGKPPGGRCSRDAAKRLTAIREYVEFGSGFKIAMRGPGARSDITPSPKGPPAGVQL